ncbi:MAG TPA: septum formation initiator family protein [Segetibacter sp.]|jgi:cell division protein FtsB
MTKVVGFIKIFSNKYLFSLVLFIVWISFFDRNDLITQVGRHQELQKLEVSASFYEKEIATTKKDLMDLNSDPLIMEKFAREKFYLKRPNEEIFVVTDSSEEKK